jgi:hypothetical protein
LIVSLSRPGDVKIFAFIALLATAAPAVASGEAVPRYDPGKQCAAVSDAVGSSESLKQFCLKEEQKAYDGLKQRWADIPPKIRKYCDEVARAGSTAGDYTLLEFCINDELESAKSNSTTEFKF